MDPGIQIETITAVLEAAGVEVRPEHLGGSGGSLCKLRGKRVLFIDLDADIATRAEHCVVGLASMHEVEGIFLLPELRELVDRHRTGRTA
ncbi:MAG: hypothetical protein HY287_08015 [Planctomycetes bacterium]|nr:hypothetical protein [Planctomycetota bacterium]